MVSGDHDEALVDVVESTRRHRFGKYRGIVEELGEGDHVGLIRVHAPELYGEDLSPWAEPVVPFAGVGYGAIAMPVRGDGVWIECAAGHRDRPLWTGGWWSRARDVPEGAGPKVRVWRSPKGHRVVVDDDADEIRIIHGSGAEIVMTNDAITLAVGRGKIEITDGKVTINDGALEVE
jgi:uncharacterized protein involved in type VI secretion and phage assembly